MSASRVDRLSLINKLGVPYRGPRDLGRGRAEGPGGSGGGGGLRAGGLRLEALCREGKDRIRIKKWILL